MQSTCRKLMSEVVGTFEEQDHMVSLPVVTLVVINWNKSALTLKCLDSITAHTQSIPHEIIVVDNGSTPDEIEILEQGCARNSARLIRLNQNLFFGEANNIGVEAARAKYVLLVNNDVIVTSRYLEPLLAALQDGFRAGAVGPRPPSFMAFRPATRSLVREWQ